MTRLYRPSKIVHEMAISESYELYEDICFYLVNEGYADTLEGAQIIASNLNEGVFKHLRRIVRGAKAALKRKSHNDNDNDNNMRIPHPTDFNRSVRATPYDSDYVGESYDAYDIIVSHLINEGYANSVEGAEVIAMSMSENWIEDILHEATLLRRMGYSPEEEAEIRLKISRGSLPQHGKPHPETSADRAERLESEGEMTYGGSKVNRKARTRYKQAKIADLQALMGTPGSASRKRMDPDTPEGKLQAARQLIRRSDSLTGKQRRQIHGRSEHPLRQG